MNMPPAFSWSHLNMFHLGWLPSLLVLAGEFLYLRAARRHVQWPRSRAIWWTAGSVVTFIATQGVIGVYDMTLFSAHMIQHLLLIMVAAALFAAAAPLDLFRESSKRVESIVSSRLGRITLHPLTAFGLYFLFIPLTHLTGLFNAMLSHEWLHHSEQIAFLVIGYLFFRPAFGVERGVHLHPGLRLVYVMAAVPVDTFTGLALNMTTKNPFPAYVMAGGSPLDNVHLGGAIMWIGGDGLMLLALIPLTVTWVRYETRRTRELDAELDAAEA